MRCADHIRQIKQHTVLGWFGGEHIDARTADLSRFQTLCQSVFVNQSAAGAIDDAHTLFHFCNGICIDDVAGLVGQRRVQCDEVSSFQQFFQFNLFHAQFHGAFRRQERIICDNPHFQPDAAFRSN